MKISHELPLGLLHYSYEFNDYDYCLPIFLDKYEQYKLFFTKSSNDGRFIIMDNSLFEGYIHTTEDLLSKIEWLQPNIFIVPDAWNDSATTLRNAKSWMINYKSKLPEKTNLMAVVQGKTMGELITTYQTLVDLGYTHIAINHSSEAYLKTYPDNNALISQTTGRKMLIDKLVANGALKITNYHHLLGCSLPQEFGWYKGYNFIKSVDTSNPILVGVEGERYGKDGIDWKPKEKLEYYFDKDLEINIEDIRFNVNKFKSFIRG
jgi:hypothetical protein